MTMSKLTYFLILLTKMGSMPTSNEFSKNQSMQHELCPGCSTTSAVAASSLPRAAAARVDVPVLWQVAVFTPMEHQLHLLAEEWPVSRRK